MKKINFIILALLIIPLALATDLIYKYNTDLIYKYNTDIDLKIPCYNNGTLCSSSAECNITIFYPNSSVLISNAEMSNNVVYHNLSIGNLTTEGTYLNSMLCNDNGVLGKTTFNFKVTGNGKEEPSGIVIIIFSVAFILLLFYLIVIILYGIGSIVDLDFDIIDLAYNWGGYFAFGGLFMLEQTYMGNIQLEVYLNLFLSIGGWTNFWIPGLAFAIITFIIKPLKNRGKNG